jgi:hypothetical protein
MVKVVQMVGSRFLTENWVKAHPRAVVRVGHLGCPRHKERPLALWVAPSGGWGSKGGLSFNPNEVSWEEAVDQCLSLMGIGLPIVAFKMHGSMTYTTEMLHQAINEKMKADELLRGVSL